MENLYEGIFISAHRTHDSNSKKETIESLVNWEQASLSGEEWIAKLDAGQTIQPSKFTPQANGSFTHKIKYWENTHFVCGDGDKIKGVEFLDTGEDKNPDGIELWTEDGILSEKFPELLTDAYAVGESVSSMLNTPLHRRFRLIFIFDEAITSEEHYHQILLKIAAKFPIIPSIERSPAQPVFGNAREDFKFYICGNILKLEDYPYTQEPEKPKPKNNRQQELTLNETLQDYLRRHNIEHRQTKQPNKFYVDCPYVNRHTGQIQGATDSYVFDDGTGWAFYCSHAHCQNVRTWDAFKDGHGIKTPLPDQTPPNNTGHYVSDVPVVWTEADIDQSDEDPKIVPFPEELFFGIFESYRGSLEGRTPIPDAFAFATLKHIISATLGRRIHLESQIPIYPNLYTGLIGGSSDGHKGVSLAVAKKLLQKADPNVLVLTKTATEEGLIDLFVPPELKTGTDDEGNDKDYYIGGISDLLPINRVSEIVNNIDSHESVRIMGSFEEFSAVLNRTKKVTFSGITELFMELYDNPPEILVPNKQNKSRAEFPTYTMIGGSAFELIEQSLSQHFVSGGFTNRIEWYLGEEKDPIFIYKNAEPSAWTECVDAVNKIRDSYVNGQSFNLTEDAYKIGDRWNIEFTGKHKSIDNILVAGSMKRMKIFLIKNALIFAAMEHRGDFLIHDEDMLRSVRLAEYNSTVVEVLFENFASSEHQRVCNRIMEILKKTPLLSSKQLQNQMRWADIKEIDLCLDLLIKMEIIAFQKPKRTPLYFATKTRE